MNKYYKEKSQKSAAIPAVIGDMNSEYSHFYWGQLALSFQSFLSQLAQTITNYMTYPFQEANPG